MPTGFTRQQLLDSLLQEVTRAQASFQAAQLSAWRELAPGAALPGMAEIAALQQLEMRLAIKPYRPRWYVRLYRTLTGQQETGDPQYLLASSVDRETLLLTLRIGKGNDGFTAETAESSTG